MRLAIAGKGGTGKTTIAGTLARVLARSGRDVLAIDADTNPNLALLLGLVADRAGISDLPRDAIRREVAPDGTVTNVFVGDAEELIARYGTVGPDGVRLLVMGTVGHSGSGCLCRAHATVRGLLGQLVADDEATDGGSNGRDVIVDMEAGLEHLSRGTGRHLSRFVATVEPYYRSMETARRVAELAGELGIRDVLAVANKVRDAADRAAIASFCASHGLRLAGEIPYDPTLVEAERAGATPLDYAPDAPAVTAIRGLAATLMA